MKSPIWRGYDLAALDAQYQLAGIDDLDALMARRRAASAQARSTLAHQAALRYGAHPSETLDFYPALLPAAPLLVFIHGGTWQMLDAATFAFVAAGFTPQGAAVAVLDFPMIPQVRIEGMVDSLRRAIGWLRGQAAALGFDPARICVAGHSSGAHLASVLGCDVACMGLISGTYDLRPVRLATRNDGIGFTEADVAAWSPMLRPLMPPVPATLAVGGDETQEFRDQTREFAMRHRQTIAHIEVPGANHVTVLLDHFSRPGTALNTAMARMIGLCG